MTPGPALAAEGQDRLRILDDYDFSLPSKNISQRPTERREDARLMVLDRDSGELLESGPDHRVSSLPKWLRSGDLLVVNVTRVLPAKLLGRKATGGGAEVLLLGPEPSEAAAPGDFRALVKCRGRLRVGLEFEFSATSVASSHSESLSASLVAMHDRGEVTLRFSDGADPYAVGHAPLPPYIKRSSAPSEFGEEREVGKDRPASTADDSIQDLERYQTVYARAPGAVAAPTAGLHLTDELLAQLRDRGVEIAEVVLHVGAGTFRPLDADAFARGRLHAERFELPATTAAAIEGTRARGGRVIAVGTTTTRVLESCCDAEGEIRPGSGETDLFIRPGGPPFRVVDALLTNFHLPRSSLLLLVAEFAGREALLAAYAEAVTLGFRFYSFGDAMLIVRRTEARPGV